MSAEESLTYDPSATLPSSEELQNEKKDGKESLKDWKPEPEERLTVTRVLRRIEQEMLPSQQPYHKEWDDAKKIYESVIVPDPLKESFRIPLSHMIIDAALAEEIDAFPDIDIDTQEPDDKNKLPFLNAAKKYALSRTNWEKVKMEALRIRRIYGFAPVRIYYRSEKRMIRQRIPLKGDQGMTLAYESVMDYPYDDIWLEVIDNPRRFLLGDCDTDVYSAADCALITEVEWDSYKQKVQYDRRFKNIDCVHPDTSYGVDIDGELISSELSQPNGNSNLGKVKIYEYWNKYTDEYITLANGVVIRDTCLVDDHKELPFAVMHMYRRPHTFYSKGIPKLIESIEAAYNAIMQAEVRATKLAFPILVTDDDNAIDPRQIAPYPGVVLEGGLDRVDLKQLGSVPNEVYQLKDKLEENLIWLTGINFKQVYQADNTSQQRVGIEALKKESMLARVNSNLRENEASFLIRLGDLLIQDIMQYFPTPKLRRLMPAEDAANLPNEGIVYDAGKPVGILELRKIPVEGMQLAELVDKEEGLFELKTDSVKGHSYILARPEYIRCKSKLDVRAIRPSAMGSSKEAKKLLFMELSQHALQVNLQEAQMGGTPPETDPQTGAIIKPGTPGKPIWDQTFLETQLAEVNDLPVNKAIVSAQSNAGQSDIVKQVTDLTQGLNKTFDAQFPMSKQQFMQDKAGKQMNPQDQSQFSQQVNAG